MKIPIFIKAFFSPFKRPKLTWYFGKTAVGVPIFLPRKFVKATPELAHKATLEELERREKMGYKKDRTYGEIFEQKMKCSYSVPLKIGFSWCDVLWKTKYTAEDIRHEYNPVISFVTFGYQIAVSIIPESGSHYWECFIFYLFRTDKNSSTLDRLKEARNRFNCTWTTYLENEKITVNYWDMILKK